MSVGSAVLWGLCLAGSGLLTGIVRHYAIRRNLFDIPNARSSHATPTPRGGGLAIVVIFYLALLYLAVRGQVDWRFCAALGGAGSAIALVGWVDDRISLPARVRFGIHVVSAVLVSVILGDMPAGVFGAWGLQSSWIIGALSVFTLVGCTNLFNFMDGIDGIAAMEAAFVSSAGATMNFYVHGSAGLTAVLGSLAAASVGFLGWNWPPARVFMGDVGSGFLGFILSASALTVSRESSVPLDVWLILAGVFLADSSVTLFRRVIRGDRWFEAHRTHAYQLLSRRWGSHRRVTLLSLAINLFWLLPWAGLALAKPAQRTLCVLISLTPLFVGVIVIGAGRRPAEQQ